MKKKLGEYTLIKYIGKIFKHYQPCDMLFSVFFLNIIIYIIDYYNIPTLVFSVIGYGIIVYVLMILLIIIFNIKIQNLIKLKVTNYIDYYLIIIFCSILMHFFVIKLSSNKIGISFSKVFFLVSIIIIDVCMIIIRKKILFKEKTENKDIFYNVYDLKQLYNGEIKKDKLILLKEDEVEYDLLDRGLIIDQIKNTLLYCNNRDTYVIALKGKWGSGKTTILKNVKKRLPMDNIIYIDDFDPWIYNDEKFMVSAFFDILMKKINCDFSINETRKITNIFVNVVKKYNTHFDNFFSNYDINIPEINRIKKIVDEYLERNNKKIILVLDNLERCSSENILFIVKNIFNIFNFKKMIFVLSYDEVEMKKHFNNKLEIDYSYLEKIIQHEFYVPKIDNNVFNDLVMKSFSNYLYNFNCDMKKEDKDKIISIISHNIKDIRDLKRLINSVFYQSINNLNDLNIVDTILIEFIKFKNIDLWEEIYNNEIFYISNDMLVNEEFLNKYYLLFNNYNEDATNYFCTLFLKNTSNVNDYKDILSLLFPNVKKYLKLNNECKKIDFINSNNLHSNLNNIEDDLSELDKKIYNAKYFGLYFTQKENEYTRCLSEVEDFILYLNSEKNCYDKLLERYLSMLNKLTFLSANALSLIRIRLGEINKDKILILLIVMYDTYQEINVNYIYLQKNEKAHVIKNISVLITILTESEYFTFINKIRTDIKNIFLIKSIIRELSNDERRDAIEEVYIRLNYLVIENHINIYLPKYYNLYNIKCFKDDYDKVLKDKIGIYELPLFVLDFTDFGMKNDNIYYELKKDIIDKFYGWDKMINNLQYCKDSDLKSFLIEITSNLEIDDDRFLYFTNKKEMPSFVKLAKKYIEQ